MDRGTSEDTQEEFHFPFHQQKLSLHFFCVKPRNKRIEFPFSFHQQALDSVSCVKTKKQEKNRLPKKSLPKTADLDKSNKSLSMKTSWPWASTMMPF
jgi:response regulator of citrate/malate metabolism